MKRHIFALLFACLLLAPATARAQDSNDRVAISSDFTYGVFAGVGGALPTGSLSDNFKGCVTFVGGLQGGYDQWRLKTAIQYGQPSIKGSNIFSKTDAAGHATEGNAHADPTWLGWSLQLGYQLPVSNRLSVTPNVGVAYTRYNWDIDQLEWSKDEKGEDQYTVTGTRKAHLSHWGIIASVDFDVRLHTTVTNTPFIGSGYKRFTSSIRISPWVTYAKYESVPSVKGCMIGVSVSYLGLLQSLM